MMFPSLLHDIWDTILMGVLVVGCAYIIKRDVALRLLAIMAALSLLTLTARLLEAPSLVRVLDILTASTPIILAIIFQTDLRRTLLALGRRSQSSADFDGDIETVDEILKALRELADRRIGALIVIVRHIPLDHIISVGTQLDAKVTCELLNSIFLPYSPIHDGAVIIHSGKLTRAGCVLPLSQNPDIARSFGTRHRAALGVSELSDSYALVVSEETGKISVVHEAKITYDLEPAELRRIMKKALGVKRLS